MWLLDLLQGLFCFSRAVLIRVRVPDGTWGRSARARGEAWPAACRGRRRVCDAHGAWSARCSSVSGLPHLQPARRCGCVKTV